MGLQLSWIGLDQAHCRTTFKFFAPRLLLWKSNNYFFFLTQLHPVLMLIGLVIIGGQGNQTIYNFINKLQNHYKIWTQFFFFKLKLSWVINPFHWEKRWRRSYISSSMPSHWSSGSSVSMLPSNTITRVVSPIYTASTPGLESSLSHSMAFRYSPYPTSLHLVADCHRVSKLFWYVICSGYTGF